VVPLWHAGVADEIERVSTDEATAMTPGPETERRTR
jgi:hypothetical protein